MKFLFPSFLFALFAVAIPIIIHLFSFRQYRTVYFSNVNFLREIKKESKNKSKLKQLLILAARILAITFLVVAFSQPYIPTGNLLHKNPQQVVGIYVDNSFSMNAISTKGQLIETARNKALEICMAYPAGTKFRLFTNDMEPKHQHLFNKEQLIQQVAAIQPSPVVIPLSMVFNRFASGNHLLAEPNADKHLYFISDFQRSVTDFENFGNQPVTCWMLPLSPAEIANLYVDSCWFDVPAHYLKQEEEIFVRIKNSSSQSFQNLPLKIVLNDSIKSITNFTINAQNEIITSLKFTNNSSGLQLGQIEISDYPFTHDNNWYISYFVEPNLKALIITDNSAESKEGASYLSAVFGNDNFVHHDVVNSQNLQISQLTSYNTIFVVNTAELSSGLISELADAAASGLSIVFFPAERNLQTLNSMLAAFNVSPVIALDTTTQKISGIDFDNPFFSGVFRKKEENPVLPSTRGHFQFSANRLQNDTRLLWFQNNDAALTMQPYEKGKVYLFSFPLNKANEAFSRDVIFVPVVYKIVLNSAPDQMASLIVGKNSFYQFDAAKNINIASNIEMVNRKNKEKFVPEKNITGNGVLLQFDEFVKNDGHYLVQSEDSVIAAVAFNYDRKESDLSYFSFGELNERIEAVQLKNSQVIENAEGNFAEVFDEIQNGKQLWKWFIIMALLMILAEVALIRFWKDRPKT